MKLKREGEQVQREICGGGAGTNRKGLRFRSRAEAD